MLTALRAASGNGLAEEIAAWPIVETERLFHATAVHESGHALAAVRLAINFNLVAIDARADEMNIMMGYVEVPNLLPRIVAGKGERAVMPYLVYFLAGPVAEGRVYGKPAMERGYQLDVDDERSNQAVRPFIAPAVSLYLWGRALAFKN